jgi:hypothetical protein
MQFVDFLSRYGLRKEAEAPLRHYMQQQLHERNETSYRMLADLQKNLEEVEKAIYNMEESYYVKRTMSEESYIKFRPKYAQEKVQILRTMEKTQVKKSNLENQLETAISFSRNLATVWVSSSVAQKEALQKLVFPDGVIYNLEKRQYRTEKLNAAFQLFISLNSVCGEKEKGQNGVYSILSSQVGTTRFEPATLPPQRDALPFSQKTKKPSVLQH